jgi:hypothetical protein
MNFESHRADGGQNLRDMAWSAMNYLRSGITSLLAAPPENLKRDPNFRFSFERK